ncbi:hypothetical protein L226DRAFT_567174 [Lentinus tigrinus ALCF2SS1-7]|uniref:DUF6533 domain-containing protein n=1 Tax=Lentinus tigrinus ALCF2SS1-6 TaxID=1328759 RepID=A0A5C2SR61_9APHY|nr:hypothetical protein L227DRAFT_607094 [Lentinus tigrinus ALCF2SS1-6]RPD78978.1 hypothetical protein L226DRAFT_567174 [Lentinus tigrinus ALCF2SS1-7]
MSSLSAADLAALTSTNLGYSFSIAASTFLIYEYLITLDREVGLFWKGKITRAGGSALFLSNRYLPLVTQLLYLVEYTAPIVSAKPSRGLVITLRYCAIFVKVSGVVVILQYFPWALFSALRTYALSKNKAVSLLVLLLSLVTPSINLARYGFGVSGIVADLSPVIPETCLPTDDLTSSMELHVLLVMNVLHMAFSLRSIISNADISEITIFTEPITAILVSRFLIDLQEANKKALDQTSSDDSNATSTVRADDSLHFANFVNSFGASIAVPGAEEEYYLEEAEADKPELEDCGGSPEVLDGTGEAGVGI